MLWDLRVFLEEVILIAIVILRCSRSGIASAEVNPPQIVLVAFFGYAHLRGLRSCLVEP